jgi:hypothetical protein
MKNDIYGQMWAGNIEITAASEIYKLILSVYL